MSPLSLHVVDVMHVRAERNERCYGVAMPICSCIVHWSVSKFVPLVDELRAVARENNNRGRVPIEGGIMECTAQVPVHKTNICAHLEQLHDSLGLAALGSLKQRTLPTIIRAVDVRSLPQKAVHLFDLPVLRGPDELPISFLFKDPREARKNSSAACQSEKPALPCARPLTLKACMRQPISTSDPGQDGASRCSSSHTRSQRS